MKITRITSFPFFRVERKICFCDNCGKHNPETFPNSRLTKCCSTYDKNHPNAFYGTYDENGEKVFSIGKVIFETQILCFPLSWTGFWN